MSDKVEWGEASVVAGYQSEVSVAAPERRVGALVADFLDDLAQQGGRDPEQLSQKQLLH